MLTFIKKNLLKIIFVVLALIIISFATILFFNNSSKANSQNDILTLKPTDSNRMQITVLVKNAFSINGFEKAVEQKFPNIDIVQVGNFSHDRGIDEYAARIKNDDLTDIVMTWPLEVGEEYFSDRLLELSSYEFTSKYNLSMLNKISNNGDLYYLPGPSQVRGIVYNKTLFKENGWTVPSNYNEFVDLCQTIETTGIRPLQLGFENPEVLDTAFVGYGYSDCYSEPKDSQWISEYNEGQHSFGEHFTPALDTFQSLIDKGIFKKGDLTVDYAEREHLLFTRQCAMVEDSVLLTRMGELRAGTLDEFGLMPFFNPNGGEDWSRLYMVCYIGLNKHLAETQNKEKFDTVLKLMEYISTPEGQDALMIDTGAMFSSLSDVPPPDIPEIEYLLNSLKNGRFAIFPELKNAQGALREGLAGMLTGDMTKADVIKLVDQQNASPTTKQENNIIGKATHNFSLIDTGNFITDIMREETGSDFALFLDGGKDGKSSGKGVNGKIYKGNILESDISRIMPDVRQGEQCVIWNVTMTGENLINTLENSIKVDNNIGGWFYYFSGLKVEFNPTDSLGKRVKSVTTSDNKEIDPKKTYTIACMDYTVPEEYIIDCNESDILIAELLKKEIKSKGTISPSKDGRFTVLQ